MYYACHASIIRKSVTGILTGTYHYCLDTAADNVLRQFVGDMLSLNITREDDFGAYVASNEFEVKEEYAPVFSGMVKSEWEGFATGYRLVMDTYGGGTTSEGEVVLVNDNPDHKECDLFRDGVLGCQTRYVEYCSSVDGVPESLACEDRDGQWQYTYEVKSVLAMDVMYCPEPPANFCESNMIPDPSGRPDEEPEESEPDESESDEFERRLKEDGAAGGEKRAACPFAHK